MPLSRVRRPMKHLFTMLATAAVLAFASPAFAAPHGDTHEKMGHGADDGHGHDDGGHGADHGATFGPGPAHEAAGQRGAPSP